MGRNILFPRSIHSLSEASEYLGFTGMFVSRQQGWA
jgi:hypothetical protein